MIYRRNLCRGHTKNCCESVRTNMFCSLSTNIYIYSFIYYSVVALCVFFPLSALLFCLLMLKFFYFMGDSCGCCEYWRKILDSFKPKGQVVIRNPQWPKLVCPTSRIFTSSNSFTPSLFCCILAEQKCAFKHNVEEILLISGQSVKFRLESFKGSTNEDTKVHFRTTTSLFFSPPLRTRTDLVRPD